MRFLIDENLSPILAELRRAAGHNASHVRDVGMESATDLAVTERAKAEQRVVVSADSDFGTLLARNGVKLPSVLLIRRLVGRRAAEQASIILANLPATTDDLESGAVVVLTEDWVRIRPLPIHGYPPKLAGFRPGRRVASRAWWRAA